MFSLGRGFGNDNLFLTLKEFDVILRQFKSLVEQFVNMIHLNQTDRRQDVAEFVVGADPGEVRGEPRIVDPHAEMFI